MKKVNIAWGWIVVLVLGGAALGYLTYYGMENMANKNGKGKGEVADEAVINGVKAEEGKGGMAVAV